MSSRGPHARPYAGGHAAGSARAEAGHGRLDHLDDDAAAPVPDEAVDARRLEQADRPSSRMAAMIGSGARFLSSYSTASSKSSSTTSAPSLGPFSSMRRLLPGTASSKW
jgi:hypothetical protein